MELLPYDGDAALCGHGAASTVVVAGALSGFSIAAPTGFAPGNELAYHLLTPDGSVRHCSAMARYVARAGPRASLLGNSLHEQSLVDQWLEFASTEIAVPAFVLARIVSGDNRFAHGEKQVSGDLQKVFEVLEGGIRGRFLVGAEVTLADAAVACHLFSADKLVRSSAPKNVLRWYKECLAMAEFSALSSVAASVSPTTSAVASLVSASAGARDSEMAPALEKAAAVPDGKRERGFPGAFWLAKALAALRTLDKDALIAKRDSLPSWEDQAAIGRAGIYILDACEEAASNGKTPNISTVMAELLQPGQRSKGWPGGHWIRKAHDFLREWLGDGWSEEAAKAARTACVESAPFARAASFLLNAVLDD